MIAKHRTTFSNSNKTHSSSFLHHTLRQSASQCQWSKKHRPSVITRGPAGYSLVHLNLTQYIVHRVLRTLLQVYKTCCLIKSLNEAPPPPSYSQFGPCTLQVYRSYLCLLKTGPGLPLSQPEVLLDCWRHLIGLSADTANVITRTRNKKDVSKVLKANFCNPR